MIPSKGWHKKVFSCFFLLTGGIWFKGPLMFIVHSVLLGRTKPFRALLITVINPALNIDKGWKSLMLYMYIIR